MQERLLAQRLALRGGPVQTSAPWPSPRSYRSQKQNLLLGGAGTNREVCVSGPGCSAAAPQHCCRRPAVADGQDRLH